MSSWRTRKAAEETHNVLTSSVPKPSLKRSLEKPEESAPQPTAMDILQKLKKVHAGPDAPVQQNAKTEENEEEEQNMEKSTSSLIVKALSILSSHKDNSVIELVLNMAKKLDTQSMNRLVSEVTENILKLDNSRGNSDNLRELLKELKSLDLKRKLEMIRPRMSGGNLSTLSHGEAEQAKTDEFLPEELVDEKTWVGFLSRNLKERIKIKIKLLERNFKKKLPSKFLQKKIGNLNITKRLPFNNVVENLKGRSYFVFVILPHSTDLGHGLAESLPSEYLEYIAYLHEKHRAGVFMYEKELCVYILPPNEITETILDSGKEFENKFLMGFALEKTS